MNGQSDFYFFKGIFCFLTANSPPNSRFDSVNSIIDSGKP